MYDPRLDAFLAAAELGSFTKAAEKCFISTTAVVKQMNQLESETGVTLFHRSKRGISLTEAGKSLYEDSRLIIRLSKDAVRRARRIEHPEVPCVRIGTSVLRSGKQLIKFWSRYSASYPGIKVYIVPFEDSYHKYLDTVRNLGKEIDVIAGVYPSDLWNGVCSVWKLADLPICCAVSRVHPLARKEKLTIQDLYGQRLMIVERGTAEHIDAVRDELMMHPQIQISDTHFYDVEVFNECAMTGSLMITAENWSDVHPLLVTIPIDWDFTVPYGLIYAKQPSANVTAFVEAVKENAYALDWTSSASY